MTILPACQPAPPREGEAVGRPGEPWVLLADPNDEELQRATERARASLDDFLAALRSPRTGQSHFLVKAAIGGEAMWVGTLRWDGESFNGTLSNEPFAAAGPRAGAKVTVARDAVLDWMYIEQGKLRGGYTIRVLRGRTKVNPGWPFAFE